MRKEFLVMLALAVLAFGALPANAQLSSIKLTVKVESKVERDGDNQKRETKLKINLVNLTQQEYGYVTIKYNIVGRDKKASKYVILGSGAKDVALGAGGKADVETEDAKYKYNPGKAKDEYPTGSMYFGYGVQVIQDTKVLAESYNPAAVKAELNKPATAAPPKK